MTTYPMTKAEAEKYLYDKSESPLGGEYNPSRCAAEISYTASLGRYTDQCLRRPGKGPDGLYCAQHARILEESKP